MAEEITLVFDGRAVQITTKGFKGAGCLKATEELERALGKKTGDRKTSEFYETAAAKTKVGR
jgi:hypothetical protein